MMITNGYVTAAEEIKNDLYRMLNSTDEDAITALTFAIEKLCDVIMELEKQVEAISKVTHGKTS